MGSDFVTVETMVMLSAPGSYSFIKQRGAQKANPITRQAFLTVPGLASG